MSEQLPPCPTCGSHYAWWPIASAPKDGTQILVHKVGTAFMTSAGWSTRRNNWVYDFEAQPIEPNNQPTHWRPMPRAHDPSYD